MVKKNPCQGNTGNLEILPKHREFGNFAKTQGIWKFCQNTGNLVCSSCKFPDSREKDISIFAAKIQKKSWIILPSQFGVCNSHKSHKLAQGKFAVIQGKKQGKHREFENEI